MTRGHDKKHRVQTPSHTTDALPVPGASEEGPSDAVY